MSQTKPTSDQIVFQGAGTGAVATTVQAKLRETVSVLDFYANGVSGAKVDPTGIIDSTLGIQAALNTLKPVIFPNGIYKTSSSLKVYNSVDFDGSTINSSAAYCFDLQELKNVSLINGRLYSTATTGSVVYVGGLWSGQLRDLHIKPGNGQNGITFDAKHKDSAYPYFGVFCVQVVDCHVEGGYRCIVSNWVDSSRRNTHITIIGGWLQGAYSSVYSNGDANFTLLNTAFDNAAAQYHIELNNTIYGNIQPGEFPIPASGSHVLAAGACDYTTLRVTQSSLLLAGTPTVPPLLETTGLLTKAATNVDGYWWKAYVQYNYGDVFNLDIKRDGAVYNAIKWTGSDLKLANQQAIFGSSGNVGFGGTLNTWDNTAKGIEFPYGAVFTTSSSINMFQNSYYGVGAFKYQSTAAASYYSQSGGAHSWFNAASGTAGATVTFSKRLDLSAAGVLTPGADNTQSLGSASLRWSVVYAGSGTINTSDAREKQDIEALTEAELRVATVLKGLVKKFRFKDAVQSKGDNARVHVGVIAQEVVAAFQSEGLDAMRYGIICYDEWPEQEEALDENGRVAQEYRPAGNRYGVRYEELLAFIIAAL